MPEFDAPSANGPAFDDIDGRFAQGWGGEKPNGCHVNVILARRGSPTAASMVTTFTAPSEGFTPILVSVGEDQPSYQTVQPPTIMMNKAATAGGFIAGAAQVGIAQGVLDAVAGKLLSADQDTVVFVAVWLDPDADDETAAKHAARRATAAAVREAAAGRAAEDVRAMVERRDELTHPFYTGS